MSRLTSRCRSSARRSGASRNVGSPRRRAILEQLGIPFEVIVPQYEEELTGADPVAEVERHAEGKARSVAGVADERPVLGVDTEVVLGGRVYGKPSDEAEAEAMLEE